MVETTLGRNGYGKYLKPIVLLSLIFLLMWSSILWAGPMGDPEPVGADAQATIDSSGDSQLGDQGVLSDIDIELAWGFFFNFAARYAVEMRL